MSPWLENSRTSVLYRTTNSETERGEIDKTRKANARRGTVSKKWLITNQDKSHGVSFSSLTVSATGESQTLKETKGYMTFCSLDCWYCFCAEGQNSLLGTAECIPYFQLIFWPNQKELLQWQRGKMSENWNVAKVQGAIVINKHQMTGRTPVILLFNRSFCLISPSQSPWYIFFLFL